MFALGLAEARALGERAEGGSDAVAVVAVEEPDAEDVGVGLVEEEGVAVLELEVGGDGLEEEVEGQRVHHHEAVQRLDHSAKGYSFSGGLRTIVYC